MWYRYPLPTMMYSKVGQKCTNGIRGAQRKGMSVEILLEELSSTRIVR